MAINTIPPVGTQTLGLSHSATKVISAATIVSKKKLIIVISTSERKSLAIQVWLTSQQDKNPIQSPDNDSD